MTHYDETNDIKEFYETYDPDFTHGTIDALHTITREQTLCPLPIYTVENGILYLSRHESTYVNQDDEIVYVTEYFKCEDQEVLLSLLNDINSYKKDSRICSPRIIKHLDFDVNNARPIPDARKLHQFHDGTILYTHGGRYYIEFENSFYDAFLSDTAQQNGTFSIKIAADEAIASDIELREYKDSKRDFYKIINEMRRTEQ